MPAPLLEAQRHTDRALDCCYNPEPLPADGDWAEHLFAIYEKLTAAAPRRRHQAGRQGAQDASRDVNPAASMRDQTKQPQSGKDVLEFSGPMHDASGQGL